MLKRSKLFIGAYLLLLLGGCQTTPIKEQSSDKLTEAPQTIEQTTSIEAFGAQKALKLDNAVYLDHKYFVVHYNREYRLANYVEYKLTADQIKKSRPGTRKDSFRADKLLSKELRVVPAEYSNTGYDKGHLANSADFTFTSDANRMTFVMSNMVPQTPSLNRDAWGNLENQVRLWACGEQELKVISGPILKKDLKKFKGGLSIPEQFFKIVLDETPPKKMLAFVYAQKDDKTVMASDRQTTWEKLKTQIKGQIEVKEVETIASYPKSELSDWKSEDCVPKPKKKKLIVKK